MPIVTVLYAGLLGLISMGVAFPAGSLRGKLNISVGDGGNRDLLLAMRRHTNFTELPEFERTRSKVWAAF
jgi:uncharacterized membrane protein YecN with MAPEG domain